MLKRSQLLLMSAFAYVLSISIANAQNQKLVDEWKVQSKYTLGVVSLAKGDTNKAIDCYNTALSMNPKHTGSLFELGRIYLSKGNTDEATRYLQKVVSIDPEDQYAFKLLGDISRQSAINYYRISAKMGNTDAQDSLKVMGVK